jgi:chromosome partitioning protein
MLHPWWAWRLPKCAVLVGAAVPVVAPVVLHQRKAFSSRMQEGRTADEPEPDGKAAAELTALFRWLSVRTFDCYQTKQPQTGTGAHAYSSETFDV